MAKIKKEPEIIITIDGPAGSGKSTIARLVAKKINAVFLDTGSMYRAVTLIAIQEKIELSDEKQMLAIIDRHNFKYTPAENGMNVKIDNEDVTEKIRSTEVTENAKYPASNPKIRQRLVQMQRSFAKNYNKVVTEGRDQGTVVFPGAKLKIFLTADIDERARRRLTQLEGRCSEDQLQKTRLAIQQRDHSDKSRKVGPLQIPPNAVIIDSTNMTIEQVVEKILCHINQTEDRNG